MFFRINDAIAALNDEVAPCGNLTRAQYASPSAQSRLLSIVLACRDSRNDLQDLVNEGIDLDSGAPHIQAAVERAEKVIEALSDVPESYKVQDALWNLDFSLARYDAYLESENIMRDPEISNTILSCMQKENSHVIHKLAATYIDRIPKDFEY